MEKPKFKVDDKIEDTWYPEWGSGVIKKVLKTRYKIIFSGAPFMMKDQNNCVTYDFAHAHNFLQLTKR